MKSAFLALVVAAAASNAFAQQYKWVDEMGRVRYGDLPPAGVQATPLRPPPPGAATPAPEMKKDAAKAATPKRPEDTQKEREMQAKAEQDAQIKRENCARAQDVLRTMESGQRIARVDSKGERYYLDDAQIAQETAKARESVQQWCK
ncbi:MAG TPA: DUF4124 domain-containing protein [Burkholderiales bacterium]|nr:DUF4124 domain-containing protein [Burkholderiales bacterium]